MTALNSMHGVRLGGSGYSNLIRSLTPYVYYPLNEVNGTVCTDAMGVSSGNYTSTTLGGGPSMINRDNQPYVTGNGTTSLASVGTLGTFGSAAGGGVSFMAWVKSTNTTSLMRVCGVVNGSADAITVQLNADSAASLASGKIRVSLVDGSGSPKTLSGATTNATSFNDGLRHLIVATWDAATNTIQIFVDAVSAAITYGVQATPNTFHDYGIAMYLLAFNNNGTALQPFAGSMQHAAFFKRVLTQAEINSLYLSGANGI